VFSKTGLAEIVHFLLTSKPQQMDRGDFIIASWSNYSSFLMMWLIVKGKERERERERKRDTEREREREREREELFLDLNK
jgi:hypothetical protein